MCLPVLKTLTLFQTKLSKCIPYFRPCDVWQIRQLSIDLRRTGLRDTPNDVHVSFSLRSMSSATHVTLKTVSHDQTDRIYTLFQTKMAKSIPYFRLEMLENDTLWGGTYPYGLYMGVPPPQVLLASFLLRFLPRYCSYLAYTVQCIVPIWHTPYNVHCYINYATNKMPFGASRFSCQACRFPWSLARRASTVENFHGSFDC